MQRWSPAQAEKVHAMNTQELITPRRKRHEEARPSALANWGTGLACLTFMVFVFWLAGMKF